MRELTIGRNPENDIQLSDPSVSRQHAVLVISGTEFSVRDNGSANGTYVNGIRINGMSHLKRNDILKVGNSLVPWMNYIDMVSPQIPSDPPSPPPAPAPPVQEIDLPNAQGAQVCGILGLIFSLGLVGIILNIIALSLAGGAISRYKADPTKYTERSFRKAKAGQTMGIIGLSLFGFIVLMLIAANA